MAGKLMAAPACQVQHARRGFDLSEEVLAPTAAEARRVGLAGHLRRLEAEAIAIFREVAAEFRNPVLLYSMGKDSSVLLHLARKAFHPARLPLPLLHVDTTWKFREMTEFRDATAARLGLELIVHVNQEGLERGISPVASRTLTLGRQARAPSRPCLLGPRTKRRHAQCEKTPSTARLQLPPGKVS